MKERTTQILLAVVAGLLAIHLVRPAPGAVASPKAEVEAQTVLRAQSIEVVNREGKVVAQLYTGDDGGGNLRLRSGDGTVRVKLGATDDGSGLLLLDKQVEPAVTLGTGKAGTSLTLAEQGKEKRVIEP